MNRILTKKGKGYIKMKKTLSFVLAIVMIAMVFATIPFTAFAAEETTTPTSPDDVVMKVYTVEGETKTLVKDIKRSELGNFGEGNKIGGTETAAGKNVVVDILLAVLP